jgi:hypothetical protein
VTFAVGCWLQCEMSNQMLDIDGGNVSKGAKLIVWSVAACATTICNLHPDTQSLTAPNSLHALCMSRHDQCVLYPGTHAPSPIRAGPTQARVTSSRPSTVWCWTSTLRVGRVARGPRKGSLGSAGTSADICLFVYDMYVYQHSPALPPVGRRPLGFVQL